MSLLRPAASVFLLVSALPALPLAAAPPRGYAARPADPTVVQHKVTRGETLWSISQKHRTSVGAIMDFNHLPDHNVREGMLLRIPPNVVESVPQARHHIHVVKRGEDFWSIADRYDIDSSVLAKANPNVNPNRIHQDMEIIIPVVEQGDKSTKRPAPGPGPGPLPPSPRPQTAGMVQHTVADNETFYSIGRKYGVPMEAVVAANPTVRPERLRGGMKVWVPSKNAPPPPPPPAPAPSKSKATDTTARNRARTHTVKENDSIASIAKKYGVSESALLRENKLEEDDPIYIDDVLKIPGSSSSGSGSGTVATPPKLASAPPPRTTPAPSPAPSPSQTRMPVNSPPNTVGSDGAIRSYIVSAGENENTICDAFGISKQTLFEYNHLPTNTKLKPGDEIAIPRVSRGKRR